MRKRKVLWWMWAIAVSLIVAACPVTPPEGSPTTSPSPAPARYAMSGSVYDDYNGAPIAGATLRFGEASALSGADGSFSIDLGMSAAGLDRDFGISANGYQIKYVSLVHAEPTAASGLAFRMSPLSESAYTPKEIRCRVFQSDDTTEITDATVAFLVMPMNGGMQGSAGVSYDSGASAYRHSVRRYSADCLALAWVSMPTAADSFIALRTGVDLSGPGPKGVDFIRPAATTAIEVTADDLSCVVQGNLDSPYGLLPMIFKYDSGGGTILSTSIQFIDGTAAENVRILNPQGWTGRWVQIKPNVAYSGTHVKMLLSTAETASWGPALAMPALDQALGPDEDPNLGGWSYAYATGLLSGAAVAKAQLYQYAVSDSVGTGLGVIVAFESTLALPSWLKTYLSDKGPLSMSLSIMDTDILQYDVREMAKDTYPASSHFGRLTETMGEGFMLNF